MHLIDVCIPKLGDDSPPPPVSSTRHANFPLFPGLFSHEDTAYHVDYATDDEEDPDTSKESEEFFEANEGLPEVGSLPKIKTLSSEILISSGAPIPSAPT